MYGGEGGHSQGKGQGVVFRVVESFAGKNIRVGFLLLPLCIKPFPTTSLPHTHPHALAALGQSRPELSLGHWWPRQMTQMSTGVNSGQCSMESGIAAIKREMTGLHSLSVTLFPSRSPGWWSLTWQAAPSAGCFFLGC